MPQPDNIEIHPLKELDEFAAVLRLQREIWGFKDIELLPERLFVVADKIGGQLLGAFDGGSMVAFCLCIPGLKPGGKVYLHSHMLGVLPHYRDYGLGRRLKLEQRTWALGRDIDLIEWTFDPLQVKNAFFNIERLGAIVRRYVKNQYGMTTSHLHAGLPTDRLVAEWWIRSRRVNSIVDGRKYTQPATEARIRVPADINGILKVDPQEALKTQVEVGAQFAQCFRSDLAVVGFEKTDKTGTYLLSKWESQ